MLKLYVQTILEDESLVWMPRGGVNSGKAVPENLPEPARVLLGYMGGTRLKHSGAQICTADNGRLGYFRLNSAETRKTYQIPEELVVIAVLSFGDFICISRTAPYRVTQWDCEQMKAFVEWDCAEDWLREAAE